jgi:16S rRNA (cytosine967-C5)-methyltransferase
MTDVATDARSIARELLAAVLREGRLLDEALAEHGELASLEPRDRGFVRMLVATTLRRLGEIDRMIEARLERPLPDRAAVVGDVLRLGAAQLVFLETPPHAAVDTSVALTRSLGHDKLTGLVNAVLRQIADQACAVDDPLEAGRLNTPLWLMDRWIEAHGDELAGRIAAAHLVEPPLDITLRGDPAGWAEALGAEMLPTGSLRRRGGGEVRGLPGYDEGAWWVQDAAAALPVRLLGDIAGKSVIDLCAAPGGKTAQLAVGGARVTAVDRSKGRLARLGENLARFRLEAELVAADALDWRPAAPADAVLLDAPCSATGTIRRHPDIPWQKQVLDLNRLAALQDRLLAAAAGMVKPGGLIVYASCSLEPEEGADRIEALCASGAAVEHAPIRADEFGLPAEFVTADGNLRTLPCHWSDRGGIDGFFASRLERME